MSVQIGISQLQLDNNAITRISDAALENPARCRSDDAEVDLWGKNKAPLPATAAPVLVHEVFCQIEWFEQILWFNRTGQHDQLWAFTSMDDEVAMGLRGRAPRARASYLRHFADDCSCVVSVPQSGSIDESLVELLTSYLSSPAGAAGGIERLIGVGYINKAQYRALLKCIDRYRERKRLEHDTFCQQARENETEIINVARELGLQPEPAGTGPVQWYANCPGRRGHRLMITTSDDQFGCGYCSVRGGVGELRAWVAEQTPQPDPVHAPVASSLSVQIDQNYRPSTYWPEALDQEQRLSRIHGEARRTIAREVLAEEGFAGLTEFLARETLDDEELRDWGLVHPQCMGGEYLPQLGVEDVEIARISLASTTGDQISIRASHGGGKIRYSVCDEYETEFDLAFSSSEQPLSLAELVQLIDGSGNPEEQEAGGLLICHWENMISWSYSPDESVDFAWVESAWYPELAAYYEQVATDWREQKQKELGYDEKEDCA